MNNIRFFSSKDLDYVLIALTGISAPIAIDYYHHIIFGTINSYSNGILEYITVLSLFALLIIVLSPAYYGIIKFVCLVINHKHSGRVRHKHIPSMIGQEITLNNGHSILIPEVVFTPNNVNSNHNRTFHFPFVEDVKATSSEFNDEKATEYVENDISILVETSNATNSQETLAHPKEEFTKIYVSKSYQEEPIYELIINTLPRCHRKGRPSPTNSARVFYYLLEKKILCQSMGGLIEAANYFDKKQLGDNKGAFSTELKKLTTGKYNKKYWSITSKIEEEITMLKIKSKESSDDGQPA